ncbi:Hypothetical_protein [Hexamita inflata]|uniref:Hypothetical_protein n=1 Tax=Hexamita inflata TaxID=28002 RepID=A0AA86P645_9EUKA|nr:Hypothetical protein HINF_LOCUS19223 [Hexamita inflata]
MHVRIKIISSFRKVEKWNGVFRYLQSNYNTVLLIKKAVENLHQKNIVALKVILKSLLQKSGSVSAFTLIAPLNSAFTNEVLIQDLNIDDQIVSLTTYPRQLSSINSANVELIQSHFEISEFTPYKTLTGIMYYSTVIGQNGKCTQIQNSCGERFKSEEIIKFKILFSIFSLKLWGQFSLLRHNQLTFFFFANSAPNFVEVLYIIHTNKFKKHVKWGQQKSYM